MGQYVTSEYISKRDVEECIKNGGKDQYYVGWEWYKDSPYAKYKEKMRELGYEEDDNSDRL